LHQAEKIAAALKDGIIECPICEKEMTSMHWELIEHEKMYNYYEWQRFHTGEFSGYFPGASGKPRGFETHHKYYCGVCGAEVPQETGKAVLEESMKVQRKLRRCLED